MVPLAALTRLGRPVTLSLLGPTTCFCNRPRLYSKAIVLNIPSLLIIAALCAAPTRAAAARVASSQDIEMKVSLESMMEKRLETVLRKVLGNNDVSVVVNAELLADSERPEEEVLPGVTVKKTPSSPAPMELPASLVKRVTVSVFVPHSMPDENVELARKTTERMVGLKPERGDVLNVEKLGSSAAAAAASGPESASRLTRFIDQALRPMTILLLAWLLAAGAGLLLVARRFFDPFLRVLRDAAQSLNRPGPERAAAEERKNEVLEKSAAAAEPSPSSAAESSDRKIPFSFIKERDMPALQMLLLEQSDITAAIVIQYLSPALASRALAAMSTHNREQVLGHMSSPALLNQTDVRKIEDTILAKIDYILGGEEKLVSIIDAAPIAMQGEILSIVRRRDPELGRRLDRRIVLVEDIGLLEEADLAALSRQATVRGIAVVLKYSPLIRETVLPKLKGGLGEWLTQETALIADLPEQVKELEMRRVLQALTKLVRDGKIILRKGSPPAPAIDAAPSEISVNGVQ